MQHNYVRICHVCFCLLVQLNLCDKLREFRNEILLKTVHLFGLFTRRYLLQLSLLYGFLASVGKEKRRSNWPTDHWGVPFVPLPDTMYRIKVYLLIFTIHHEMSYSNWCNLEIMVLLTTTYWDPCQCCASFSMKADLDDRNPIGLVHAYQSCKNRSYSYFFFNIEGNLSF